MKRTLALILCALLLVSAIPAMGEEAIPTINIWAGMSSNAPEETLNQAAVRDLLGINYTVEWTQGDFLTALNMKINNGGFPDICVFWNNTVAANALINSGLVMPLDEFVTQADKYPNLASIPQKILDFAKANTPDGKLWYLPGWYAQEPDEPWPGWTLNTWWVRTDLLEQVGMTKDDLATLEGVERFARAAKELTTADGAAIAPISYASRYSSSSNATDCNYIILNAFGLDTGRGASGMPPLTLENGKPVFLYDNAKLKDAYAWINKMYREGLIDMEVTTQKDERMTEKFNAGQVASFPGDAFNIKVNNAWYAMTKAEDNIAAAYIEPVKIPTAAGVETAGKNSYVNPYNGAMVFVSKNTQNLDAVLKFLDWCNTQTPEMQQVVNEGPEGLYWYWVDEPYGTWNFVPEYKKLRDSGDQALVDSCTTQMYYLSSYSRLWYPWWTQESTSDLPYANTLNNFCQLVSGSFGTTRAMHVYDAVPLLGGGTIERYLPTLDAVYEEYMARLTMAESDEAFETSWNEFQTQLESRAHWSEMKQEWDEQYKAYVDLLGEW